MYNKSIKNFKKFFFQFKNSKSNLFIYYSTNNCGTVIKQCSVSKNSEKFKPFSFLYINSKYSQIIYKCLNPIFNFENYLKNDYIDKIKYNLKCRNKDNLKRNGFKDIDFDQLKIKIIEYLKTKKEYKKIKNEFFKIKENLNNELLINHPILKKLNDVRNKFTDLDEELIPILLRIPNFFNNQIPLEGSEDIILKEIKPIIYNFKLLDSNKISYINNFRISSIIGPHSDYLIGKGAVLNFALKKYFRKYIENYFPDKNNIRQLHEIDGLDMVKSVIIEASNDYDYCNYLNNPLLIKNIKDSQGIHFVGNCSIENFICFLSRKNLTLKFLPTKFIQFGTTYLQNMKQSNSIHLVVLTNNNFNESNLEFKNIETILWNLYKNLGLSIRLRACNISKLNYNEYYRIELDVWFPYLKEWKKISQFIHYSDYISLRIGNNCTHILAGNLVDFNLLFDAIVENNQTKFGKISIPDCIKQYIYEYINV